MTENPNEKIVSLNLKVRFYLDEITPASLNVFLYQLLNDLNYEHDVIGLNIDGKDATIKDAEGQSTTVLDDEAIKTLSLREGKDLE